MSLSTQLLLPESTTVRILTLYKKYLKKISFTNSIIYKDGLVFGEYTCTYTIEKKMKLEFLFCTSDIIDSVL